MSSYIEAKLTYPDSQMEYSQMVMSGRMEVSKIPKHKYLPDVGPCIVISISKSGERPTKILLTFDLESALGLGAAIMAVNKEFSPVAKEL